ncbi:MAG TPA: wax ester/triacylglycerol synthase family O-acyltransferase [Nocardioidaceae bacterium]|nr:wax ester/triacylglycerol synthase family O-acyltransferase [Nocardioidaceae bacterium]
MVDRLSRTELAFLAEPATAPRHNATLGVFEPAEAGFDHEQLRALVADRLAFVPRYRQRIQTVPGRLANPVWVDDDDFDLSYHVRRSALPRPGSMAQLHELVARIMSRRLDPTRPLWELYLVEGLEGGRFALLSKSHQVLVDGVVTVDLAQVLLDEEPMARATVHEEWRPRRTPSPSALLLDALGASVRDPRVAVGSVRSNAEGLLRAVARPGGGPAARPVPESPFLATLSQQRRFVTVATRLDDYRAIRTAHGGTVNDVVLATLTGAMRAWLMTRAEPVHSGRSLRAMVPLSVIDTDLEPTSLGSQVTGQLLNLPVGESSPVVRLHQVSYALKAHRETGRAVAADRIADVAGFAASTFHLLGSRVAGQQLRRGFQLLVTNVPGAQLPLYAVGARMLESYPVQPLLPGHALAVGVTSYDAGVYFGITADRDAVPDVDVLGQCVEESLEELLDTVGTARRRAPRWRQA